MQFIVPLCYGLGAIPLDKHGNHKRMCEHGKWLSPCFAFSYDHNGNVEVFQKLEIGLL